MNGPPRYPPLKANHPLVGRECPACHEPFVAGDVTTLVILGPGDDPAARRALLEGRSYNAAAIPCHYACVTGDSA